MSGFDNETVYAANWDFRSVQPVLPQVTIAGQLPVGTGGSPAILVGSITSPNGSITIGYSSPNITIETGGSGLPFDSIMVDTTNGTGVNPVVPTAAGLVTFAGGQYIAGAFGTRVFDINSPSPNTIQFMSQISSTNATTLITKNGIAHFSSTDFTVDANGFVELVGAGTGDVVGTPPSTDHAIARYDGASGLLIQNSVPAIDDTGNMTTSAAVVGDNLFTQVVNSDNTNGASGAFFLAKSGGGSGGDAWHAVEVSGAGSFSWGVDNSDSDKLKEVNVSTGPSNGNTLRVMTSAGEQTLPLQPAFLAYNSTTRTNVTGNGAVVSPVIYDTEVYDQGGDFASNTFTAPVTGKYILKATVVVDQATLGNTATIVIVTSNRSYTQYQNYLIANSSNSYAISCIADLDSTDTAFVSYSLTGVGGDTADVFGGSAPITYFCGSLIC